MLIDTGSDACIISETLLRDWKPSSTKPEIRQIRKHLVTATGEIQPFSGVTTLQISVGNRTFNHEFLVADIQNDAILGVDFLLGHNCDILLTEGCIKVDGENVACFRDKNLLYRKSCRVVVSESVTVPPETEIVINGSVIDEYSLKDCGVIEMAPTLAEKNGLLVARAIVNVKGSKVPLQIVNLNDKEIKVYKGTVVAYLEDMLETSHVNSIDTTDMSHVSEPQNAEFPAHLEKLLENSCQHLDEEQSSILKELLYEHQNLFSRSSADIGHTNLVEHEIDTGDARPFKQQPYRIPLAKRLHAENEIKRMADAGIIEPSVSPWCSPIVMVTKKDGSIRFCLDFRKLNLVTRRDSKPLPRIDDTLDALSGSVWFSTMDLKSGFWQVGLSPNDRHKTAFSTYGGELWQFTVMPFGLCNAPATFERLMERVLSGLSWVKCLVFLDDIICFSKTFEQHIQNLKEIFLRLEGANLKLSPKKCILMQKEVEFLGHIVSGDGVSTDPNKIKAIEEWPVPRNVKEVRSFIGICSYYRRFIRDFAKIAKPLHKLTEKFSNFVWTSECQNSFETLKAKLTEAPILSYPREEGLYIIDADASSVAAGAVLSQEQDGSEKVLCYYSKCFSRSEKNYCVTRRELLAIVLAVKHFHHYLYGRPFLIRSDHGALRWLLNFKTPEGQLARWIETLSMYQFSIEHRPGRVHSNADALSRRPCVDCRHCDKSDIQYCKEEAPMADKGTSAHSMCLSSLPCSVGLGCVGAETSLDFSMNELESDRGSRPRTTIFDQHVIEQVREEDVHSFTHDDSEIVSTVSVQPSKKDCDTDYLLKSQVSQILLMEHDLLSSQRSDASIVQITSWVEADRRPEWNEISKYGPDVKYYWNRFQSLIVEDGVLYIEYDIQGQTKKLAVLPRSLVDIVLTQLHSSQTAGHLGVKKTYEKVSSRYYWQGMRRDVERWVETCDVCGSKRNPQRKTRAPMKMYLTGAPMERVAVDILGPFPVSKNGNRYILVICDYFTKWLDAIAVPNQEAATIADKFVKEFVCKFGVPLQLHSDQGANFESLLFKEVCKLLGIEKTRTTPLRPQSDGLVERANRILANMLSKYVSEQQTDWDEHLPFVLLAYRSSVHSTTGQSPNKIMFGRDVNLPVDLMLGKPVNHSAQSATRYCRDLEKTLTDIHEHARTKMNLECNRMKKTYDYKISCTDYNEGDLVWLFNPRHYKGPQSKITKTLGGTLHHFTKTQ